MQNRLPKRLFRYANPLKFMIEFSDCSNGHSPSLSDGPPAQTRHHPQGHCRQKLLVSFNHRQQIELDKAFIIKTGPL
jgi:hypothetical protein